MISFTNILPRLQEHFFPEQLLLAASFEQAFLCVKFFWSGKKHVSKKF